MSNAWVRLAMCYAYLCICVYASECSLRFQYYATKMKYFHMFKFFPSFCLSEQKVLQSFIGMCNPFVIHSILYYDRKGSVDQNCFVIIFIESKCEGTVNHNIMHLAASLIRFAKNMYISKHNHLVIMMMIIDV